MSDILFKYVVDGARYTATSTVWADIFSVTAPDGRPFSIVVAPDSTIIDTIRAKEAEYAARMAVAPVESNADSTDKAEATPYQGADFAAAHDAHMRRMYCEPWDAQPTDDPGTQEALTGNYGRTYAESGYLCMQATGDMFGPTTGHAPILLFQVTNVTGVPMAHHGHGGATMTHVDTYDTWDAALRAMRTLITRALTIAEYLD